MKPFAKKIVYFPLSALLFSSDPVELANHIISYGVITYGKRLYSNEVITPEKQRQINSAVAQNPINNYDYLNDEHDFYILASVIQCIKIYDLKQTFERFAQLYKFISREETIHGNSPMIKIDCDVLYDLRSGKLDYKMFCVYCAIKSVVGNRPYKRITYKTIAVRSLGFKSLSCYQDHCNQPPLPTDRQIQYTVSKLQERNFIDSIIYARRVKYYSASPKCKGKILGDAVLNKHKNRIKANYDRRERNKNLDSKIKQFKKSLEVEC